MLKHFQHASAVVRNDRLEQCGLAPEVAVNSLFRDSGSARDGDHTGRAVSRVEKHAVAAVRIAARLPPILRASAARAGHTALNDCRSRFFIQIVIHRMDWTVQSNVARSISTASFRAT
jgi:hypothetical protein